MSSKIVPVDPTEEMRLAFGNQIRTGNYNEGTLVGDLCLGIWQAMIAAAPVVEGQPVAFAWVVVSPDGKEFSELQSSEDAAKDLAHDMDGDLHPDHAGERHEIKAVYTAPPELAELQATIAQLRIDLSNQTELTNQANHHKAQRGQTIDELTAEIERLKGGQGDASTLMKIAADLACRKPLNQLYQVCETQSRIGSESLHEHLDKAGDLMAGIALDIRRAITSASQPAPVSVLKDHQFRELVNRLRDVALKYNDADQLRERISTELRACLDKVKELNQ